MELKGYEKIVNEFFNNVKNTKGKNHYTQRLFIDDGVLYSYGYHFPIAKNKHINGLNFVVVNKDGYSTTTAKQKRIIINNSLKPICFIRDCDLNNAKTQKIENQKEINNLKDFYNRQRLNYTKQNTLKLIKDLDIQNGFLDLIISENVIKEF